MLPPLLLTPLFIISFSLLYYITSTAILPLRHTLPLAFHFIAMLYVCFNAKRNKNASARHYMLLLIFACSV